MLLEITRNISALREMFEECAGEYKGNLDLLEEVLEGINMIRPSLDDITFEFEEQSQVILIAIYYIA